MNIFLAFLAFGTALVLSWFRFRIAIGVLILALPTYLIRFKIGPFPTTLLELFFGAIFFVWLIRFAREDVVKIWGVMKSNCCFFVFMGLFFIGSLIGVGVSDMVVLSLGQWRAYFLEPILLFFVIIGRIFEVNGQRSTVNGRPAVDGRLSTVDSGYIMRCLILSSLSVTLYSIFQKITGLGIATPEWTLSATRRVTAFFSSPNAVGLYLESLILLTVGQYLPPSSDHHPVDRFYTLPEFEELRRRAAPLFEKAMVGPLVRSSYHADDMVNS
jgi:hypothetical protein